MAILRDTAERTPRLLARIADLGMVVFIAAGVACARWWPAVPTAAVVVGYGGFLVWAGAFILIHAVGIRCPRCGRRMERHYDIRPLRVRGPRQCPSCRIDLNAPDPHPGLV